MRSRKVSKLTYNILSGFQAFLTAAAIVLSALLKADVSKISKFGAGLGCLVGSIQSALWIWIPVVTVAGALLAWIKRGIGSPWFWEANHAFLDTFRASVFAAFAAEPEHHHRVTLFKRKQWCFTRRGLPWRGWVIAVERSGHATQSSSVVFKGTDDPDNNDGVAGVAWGTRRPVTVLDLPELGEAPTEAMLEEYAKKGFVSVEWVRREKPTSRSLLAFPVEVKNEPWGVVVLDSRRAQGVVGISAEQYAPFAKLLGKLLERA